MKKAMILIALSLAFLPAWAQVRIVHKGKPAGRILVPLTEGSSYAREAADILTRFPFTSTPFQIIEGIGPFGKGDIVLHDSDRMEGLRFILDEDSYRLVVDNRNIVIYGRGDWASIWRGRIP